MTNIKRIQLKDLKVGDQIKTKTTTGEIVFRTVTKIWNTTVQKSDQVYLRFANGVELNCSINHPIMCLVDDSFVEVKPLDLKETDIVLTDNGFTHIIECLHGCDNDEEYIDIEVDDTHTFFASQYQDGEMVLTHNSQGAIRNGSATLFFPMWHIEAESLIVLKNNRGVEDNRVRHLDYGVQINKLLYTRLIKNQNITLFSPHEAKGLYEAFFADQDEFERLYVKYENDPNIRKKTVPAADLFSLLMQERAGTGRIYIQNVDHCNTHSPFDPKVAPVRQSNLCLTGDTIVKVQLPNNEIKDITLLEMVNGDWNNMQVLSMNVDNEHLEYKPVLAATLTKKNAEVIEVKANNAVLFKATPEHKVFTQNRGYVEVQNLINDDILLNNQNNTIAFVSDISLSKSDGVEDVYDITVQDNHNFFANDILVHNCLEIALPTNPQTDYQDELAEIALCTLSAVNFGALNDLSDMEELCDLMVRALDELLDYQDYPVKAAKNATMKRRTLGIGVINYAYYLAKNGVKYSDGSAIGLTHRAFEALQYYALKASVNLAKERGACPAFNETTYSQGILPIDTYKTDIDKFCTEPLQLDWESLRQDIVKYGLRNSTLTALMPSETSSQIANATNGIEPPRGLVSVKASKDGILKQVVPEFERLKDQYETLWEIPDNEGYLQLVGVMQKFVDQAISANTHYDPQRFPDNKVPMNQMLKDLLTAYKYGLKTLYYHNTRDGADDTQTNLQDDCAGGACKI